MISLIPSIEEVSMNEPSTILNDNNQLNLDNDVLKLKRNKPLPDYNNSLENCMNLKLV